MTDHETARTDIRRRQREVADRVLAANGTNGATRAEVNEALDADGRAEHHPRRRADHTMEARVNELAVIPAVAGEVVDNDAIEIGELYEKAGCALVDSVKYQIECGQRLVEKKASMKHGEWLPWLEANAAVLRFATRQSASRLMKVADTNGTSTHHLGESEAIQISRQTWGNDTTRGTGGTGENDWHTPAEYLDAARDVLGAIDLDPASSEAAQRRVQAERYFTPEDDGLEHEWAGRVWLNPPYAQPLIAQFVSKLVAEYVAGRVSAAIMLTHNYTDTAWFHEAEAFAPAICFTRGRVRFIDANGGIAAPTQGQTFFYFGNDVAAFVTRFAEIGFCRMPPSILGAG